MHPALRITLAVVVGAVVAVASHLADRVDRPPRLPGAGRHRLVERTEQVRAFVDGLPVGALLFVLAGWIVGAFAGGLVAAWIARSRAVLAAAIVGALVLAATVANLAMIPHPTWFAVVGIAGIVLAAFAAGRILRDRATDAGVTVEGARRG